MPRAIEIVSPPERTAALTDEIHKLAGLISLSVQHGISISPPGDVLRAVITNDALHHLMSQLDQQGLRDGSLSMTVTLPEAIVTAPLDELVAQDDSEATWEEMEQTIGLESNMTPNTVLIMAISGFLATVGIHTNALHLVVGAMILAPGFEPLSRMGLGLVLQSRAWWRGVKDVAIGYAALVIAAALTSLWIQSGDQASLGDQQSYLAQQTLVRYWTQITPIAVVIAILAGMAGAVLIAAHRSVLTAGVMVALALIPSAAIASAAAMEGTWDISGRAATRWLMEGAAVVVASALVFAWKQRRTHHRRMLT